MPVTHPLVVPGGPWCAAVFMLSPSTIRHPLPESNTINGRRAGNVSSWSDKGSLWLPPCERRTNTLPISGVGRPPCHCPPLWDAYGHRTGTSGKHSSSPKVHVVMITLSFFNSFPGLFISLKRFRWTPFCRKSHYWRIHWYSPCLWHMGSLVVHF